MGSGEDHPSGPIPYMIYEYVDIVMASLAGLEPATRCLEGSCSIHLSYRDAIARIGLNPV